MSDLKHIADDACLLEVDKRAWEIILEERGGCCCHISPPCGACCEPISEEELNGVGYTYEKGGAT
jgi:hypothetical protein